MVGPNLKPGDSLGHFRLVEELGRGGMGIVYRAHDIRLKRDVAVKVLNPRTPSDTKARQRIRNEALILSRLNHTNVECVYEFGSEDGIDFLVLELVQGSSLDELIARGPLAEQEVIGLGVQLARGLAAAHSHRVLHRDLKPGNLRVTPDNVLKILDFGLAQLMAAADGDTVTELATVSPMAGTPAYLSPEQVAQCEPDARSDIYSAGVALYELATGSKPFEQPRQLLADAILHGLPPAPRLKNKEISAGLEAVILKCLEKDPKQRYQTAKDLLADLEQLWASRDPSGRALVLHLQRKPVAWLRVALAVGLLLLLAGVGMLVWQWKVGQEVPQQKVMAVLPMDTVGQDPATSALGLGLTETLTAKLAQASDKSGIQVVSPHDLRDRKVTTADEAQHIFGTDYVLESSIQRSGVIVRINCYLVDSRTHRQMASRTIESDMSNPFGLQDKVVNASADMLPVKLKPEERRKLNAPQDTDPAAYQAYIQGRGYLQEYEKPENIENAIVEFNQAVKVDPNYALGYAGLGDAYWLQFKWLFKGNEVVARASQNCEKALSLNAQLVEGHICLGTILNGTGKHDRAIEEFKSALDSNPQSDDALRGLAEAYEGAGDFSAAETAYRRAVSSHPNYWGAYHALGLFYYRRARYADAIATFKQETQHAPDNHLSYTTLGGVYITLGDYPEAVAAFQRSIDLRPGFGAYNNLGYTYYLMHRFPESIAAFEQALKINDGNWEVWGNLGDALYWSPERRSEASAKYKRAIEIATKQLEVNPKDARVLVYLGSYLAITGSKQAALERLQRAIEESPANSEVFFRAAITYNYLGDASKALVYLEKAASLGYSRPVVRDSPEFQDLQHDSRFAAIVGSGK